MVIRRTAFVECDICKTEIKGADQMLDASVYGAMAHMRCFRNLAAREVLWLLGIDDVRMGRVSDYDLERGLFPGDSGERAMMAPGA